MKKIIITFLFLAISAFAQNVAQTVNAGQTVTITITMGQGTPPLSYQWRKNAADIPGATADKLVIPTVSVADSAIYNVKVANTAGAYISDNAILTVIATASTAPVFVLQPIGKSVNYSYPVAFSAMATGAPAPTYQWKLNGVIIPGATNSMYTVGSVLAVNVGSYTVTATNSAGSVTSATAILSIPIMPPAGGNIQFQPAI